MVGTKTFKWKIMLSVLLICCCISLFPLHSAHADIGPKPTMEFEFVFETDRAGQIVEGELLECDNPDCSDARPLEDLGPQRFQCDLNSCSSMAYGYSEFHRIRIQFSDEKTRESNIFESTSFSNTYRVTVREDDLVVKKIRGQSNPLQIALIALIVGLLIGIPSVIAFLVLAVLIIKYEGEDRADFANSRGIFIGLWVVMAVLYVLMSFVSWGITITVMIEVILALLYAVYRNRSKLVIVTMVLLVNLFTLPALWISAWTFVGSYSILLLMVAEIVIWLVESGIFYLSQRKHLPFKEALALTFVINLASFLLGLLLPI